MIKAGLNYFVDKKDISASFKSYIQLKISKVQTKRKHFDELESLNLEKKINIKE